MLKRDFELHFKKLAQGEHKFSYHLDTEFFLGNGMNLVDGGEVNVLLTVDKTNTQLDLLFQIDGELFVTCDNCLSHLIYPINGESRVYVRFAEKSDFTDDEILYVHFDEYKLDLQEMLYDFALLQLPMRKLCTDSSNRETCEESTTDRMNENTSNTEVHPELEKLKRLIKKDK